MELQTRVNIPAPPEKIGYDTPCLFMGSCFSDNIGQLMSSHKFPVLLNPFGTLFNPLSVAAGLNRLLQQQPYTASELTLHNGLWFSFDHYTGFSHPDRDTCLENINRSFAEAAQWLRKSRFLILTFGTAWAFRHNQTAKTVANCHKLPATTFTRFCAEPETITGTYNKLLGNLQQLNPGLRVIFTLSPVRHWSDGAVQNQLSKSVLHYSIQQLVQQHPRNWYFPAYEIFMDELRDYRYYASDMLHPGEQGIRYTWERFCETCISETAVKILAGVAAVIKAAGHRPMHTATTNHEEFRLNTIKKIELLMAQYPFLDFSNELTRLRS